MTGHKPFCSLILLAAALPACSTVTVTAGANLAKVGQTATLQMSQNATLSSDSMTSLRKAVAFDDGFNGQIGNTASETFLANVGDIQGKLSQYANMLASLASTYGALGDLANYNAVGTFNTSFSTLAKDSTTFLKGLNSSVDISPTSGAIAEAGGGIVIGAIQAHEVREASRTIEGLLKAVIPVMDDPQTKKLLLLDKEQMTGQIDQAALTLFSAGIYSYSPLLDDLGGALNLTSNSQSDAVVSKNDHVLAGLRNVAIEIAREQAGDLSTSYDKSVAALKALIPLHESLQNGAPLNVDTISTIVGQLQTIATSLQTARGK